MTWHNSREKMTLDGALETIRRRRPTAQPIPAFLELLKTIEEIQENNEKKVHDVAGKESRGEIHEDDTKGGLVFGHSEVPKAEQQQPKQLVDAESSQSSIDKKEAATPDEATPKRRRIIGPSRGP
jgi:hypothetical protein